MTAKQYLSQIWKIQDDVKILSDRIKTREHRIMSAGGINYDKLNVQTSTGNALEDAIIAQCDDKNKLEKEVIRYEHKLAEILSDIDELEDPRQAEVLKMYYVKRIRLKQIPLYSRSIYSVNAAYIIYEAALNRFAEIKKLEKGGKHYVTKRID